MKIIDSVSETSNFIEFNGRTYDLQLGVSSFIEIEKCFKGGNREALETLGNGDSFYKILTILLNESIIVRIYNGGERESLYSVGEVVRLCNPNEMQSYADAIQRAFVYSLGDGSEPNTADDELDKELENEDLPEFKEEQSEKQESTLNVDRWYYRIVCLLGFSEFEFYHMRINKMTALFTEYCFFNGLIEREG